MRVLVTTAILLTTATMAARSEDWPRFRGPNASGIVEGHSTPVRWDVESGTNVRWRTPIPGLAHRLG